MSGLYVNNGCFHQYIDSLFNNFYFTNLSLRIVENLDFNTFWHAEIKYAMKL